MISDFDFSAGAESGARRFVRLTGEIEAAYHEAALKFGLSDSAMRILYAVAFNGGSCPLSEVVRFSGLSKQTVNSSLRKLEADGVIRLEDAAGNRKTVQLTRKGKGTAARTVGKLLAFEDELFSSWTEEERSAYIALTDRFLSGIRALVGRL